MPDLEQITAFIDRLLVLAQKYNPILEFCSYLAGAVAALWASWFFIIKKLTNQRQAKKAITSPSQAAQPAEKILSFQDLPPSFDAKITSWGGTRGNLTLQLQITNDGNGGHAYSVKARIPKLNVENDLGDLPRNRSKNISFKLDRLPNDLLIAIFYTAIDGTKHKYELEFTGITPHNVTKILSFHVTS